MPSIAGDNGIVQIKWYHGGTSGGITPGRITGLEGISSGKSGSFSGFERLTEEEFKMFDRALGNDNFLEQIQEWARKETFVKNLKGK